MTRRTAWGAGGTVGAAALILGVYVLGFWPLRDPWPRAQPTVGRLAITGARIYPSPDDVPLQDASILVEDGKIAAIGRDIPLPGDARILACHGCVVMAGFWNVHVHFTEPKWSWAEWTSASRLNAQLADMLTSRGFTTVVDTGSNLRNTIPLRRRIETGGLLGPRIYTAGTPQYPLDGIPFYVRDSMPAWLRYFFIPQPASPAEAAAETARNLARGADIVKLFTGSYVTHETVLPMPLENARAAVRIAHGKGRLVFSHPSDLAGVLVARDSGVDVLAHAADTTDGIDAALLRSLVDAHLAMVTTLKMFATTVTTQASYLDPIYAEVRRFKALGGELLFGTDVGYMTDYDTRDEFLALQKSGLDAMDMLRMLTTAPAARFGVADARGRLRTGYAADLVVLNHDPATDVGAFSDVEYAVRNGRLIYSRR